MAAPAVERITPGTAEEAARALASGRRTRIVGGGTKLDWGGRVDAEVELSTAGLDEVVEHNEGDLTLIVRTGTPLAAVHERVAGAGQMLALDPPDGGATVGGVLATGDSGPLRHRYGAARDLVLGVTVALPDGSVARAGGKVIKNVAGYDLAKLHTGAFGTLGLIAEVNLRLHPRPERTATAVLRASDPDVLCRAAADLAHQPLEHDCLDLRWEGGEGAVMARFSGATAAERAAVSGAEVVEDDEELWAAQREGQRGEVVARVSSTQTGLPAVLAAAGEGRVVARAALGLAWVTLPDAGSVEDLRARLAPAPCVAFGAEDPWGPVDEGQLALMRRVKARFDPAGVCNPGIFAGGI